MRISRIASQKCQTATKEFKRKVNEIAFNNLENEIMNEDETSVLNSVSFELIHHGYINVNGMGNLN